MLHHNQADIQNQMMAAWAAEYTSVTICITKHRIDRFRFLSVFYKNGKGKGFRINNIYRVLLKTTHQIYITL